MAKEPVEASKTIKVDGEDQKVSGKVFYDAGADLDEMVDKFGADLVYSLAKREVHRKLQSAIRREIKSGTDPEQIPDNLAGWRPDKPHHVSKDPEQAGMEAFSQMSPEKQLEYLEKLKQKAKTG